MDSQRYARHLSRVGKIFDYTCKKENGEFTSLGWYNRRVQNKRFQILCQIGELSHTHILDYGCGLGDLWGYLNQYYKSIDYTGIDVSKHMVSEARKKYPHAYFKVAGSDFSKIDMVDYVICSGALNYKYPDKLSYIRYEIDRMRGIARKGIAFNLLNQECPNEMRNEKVFNYFSPTELKRICKEYSDRYKIITDYLPNDFSIYLWT